MGGIENSDRHLFGRTGRPLISGEKDMEKKEILLAKIPIVFATSRSVGIDEIALNELKSIYERRIHNWSQVGGVSSPIILVGREKTESAFSQLKQAYPFFKSVRFDLILNTDTAIVNYLKYTTKCVLTFGAAPNLGFYHIIKINGMDISRIVGLVFDAKNATHPLVAIVMEKANSKPWKNMVKAWGYLPVSQ